MVPVQVKVKDERAAADVLRRMLLSESLEAMSGPIVQEPPLAVQSPGPRLNPAGHVPDCVIEMVAALLFLTFWLTFTNEPGPTGGC